VTSGLTDAAHNTFREIPGEEEQSPLSRTKLGPSDPDPEREERRAFDRQQRSTGPHRSEPDFPQYFEQRQSGKRSGCSAPPPLFVS
jgi:hypothetical protein